jgi:hypothetical protein
MEMAYDMAGSAAFAVIGTANGVASGSNASISWTGLANGTRYDWFAVANDGITSTTSSTWGFTTMNPMIIVNDFANYRVFQRDIGGMSKSITISGTYSNMNWSRVEARVLWHGTNTAVVDWTTIDPTPGGGTFSGNLSVPQGGWYNVEIRALDTGGAVIGSSRGTNKWGVGMIILVIGQSNMVGNGQPPFTIANSDLAVNYSNAGRWEHLADPYDDESPPGAVDSDNDVISTYNVGGSMIPALANSLLQTFNFPIAFVPSAKGGSNLYVNENHYGWAYRNPSNHFDTSTLYGQSITKAQSVGGVELIIMHQGEADTNAHRSEAQYESDFTTMIGNYRQDLYATIPIFICQLGTIGIAGDPRTDADVVAIRNAQHDLDNGVNIFMAATAMDQPRMDDVHYTIPGLNAIGGRMAQTIKYYSGATSYYRGPAINSAVFSDGNRSQVIVTLNHRGGTDITPAMGITGFEVFDNSSSITIQSAARYATDAVQLTLSRSISSGHTVTLRYLYGMTPNISGLVKDNSPLALPLENTTADLMVLNTYILNVSKSGGGSGTVTSSPAGINCGSTCSASFNYNTNVTLTAVSSTGSTFTGWSDSGCSGTGTCTVTMDAVKSVTANFTHLWQTWYLAEGYTGAGFGTYILIQNPNASAANVTITYMLQGGGILTRNVTVVGNSRYTVVAQNADQVGLDQAFSTKLVSDQPIIVERAMYWPDGMGAIGGHVTTGFNSPQTTWYLAEGYTGASFGTYILIQNPDASAANVTITYMLQGGGILTRNVTVVENSRYTVVAQNADQVGLDQAFSTKLVSDQSIIVERAMYFNNEGHVAGGITVPQTTWYLAEGYTGAGFGTYILIQNPNASAANVTITYMLQGGGILTRNVTVVGNSRYTVVAQNADQVGLDQAFSTKLVSDRPIIVERAMYWPKSADSVGGHDSAGASSPGYTWYLAEGYTGAGYGTYILVQNPNDSVANVTITYMLQAGGTVTRSISVPANSRDTIVAQDETQVGVDQAFATKLASDQPIIVERAMYFNNGGTDTMGVMQP